MRQFLLKLAGYAFISFLILNCIAFLCLFLLRKSDFYKPQFVKNGVPDTAFDYVVLGSSTGLTTLDTYQIDSLTGKKGLNISMDDSGLSSQYLMLEFFYALQKKMKYLVLAITPWDMAVSKPVINDNDYRFLPDINEKCVFEYYKSLEHTKFKVLTYTKYFPILGVSYYNTELFYPSFLAALKPSMRNRFDAKGNYSYPVSGHPKDEEFKTTTLERSNPYFKKIQQFCFYNNITLLLYQSPIYNTRIISDNDPNFINHSDLLKDANLFYDNIHVNSKGRRICSALFAAYLSGRE